MFRATIERMSGRFSGRARVAGMVAGLSLAVAAIGGGTAHAQKPVAVASPPSQVNFPLFPVNKFITCMAAPGQTPTVDVAVVRGRNNDQMTLTLRGFKPGLQFDLFTVQRSNQNADGSPVQGFTNFGLAWYQSDIQTTDRITVVTINTILLDQIFGFDPDFGMAPLNTFHVGFWFNNPADAAPCGFTGTTPFNGDHNAGPLAFISRPDAVTNLGPLCSNPNTSTNPATCNP
jgi:hypothetical protein